MDLTKLAGSLLNSDSIDGLSKLTGASGNDVTKVLSNALPALLSGAKSQAQDSSTSKGFAAALSDHKKADTSDLGSFLGNIDLEDGAKIIGHLLGSDKDDVVKDIANDTGVSKNKVSGILSAVAPLLMSLLGQETDKDGADESGLGDLFGTLLENVDVGSLLTGLLSDNTSGKSNKKAASSKKSGSNIIGSLLGSFLK